MKRTLTVLALFLTAVALLSTSCGSSDYIKSVQLDANGATAGGTFNLPGVDATLQLQVWAIYNSGKQIDVTNASTWTVTPQGTDQSGAPLPAYGPTTVPISPSGLMSGIADICTWTDAFNTTVTPNAYWNPPIWEATGYYQVTATYRNFTSEPVGVGVGVAASNTSPIGGCGPTS
jgi:hypothetical protein